MPRCYARTKSIKYWAIIQSIFVHSKDAPYSSIPFPGSYKIYGSSLFHVSHGNVRAQGPTPAVWPKGGTLSSAGGPCLSGASWTALLRLASVPSNKARWGVNGFGAFCRNKRASPAGAKPGNTEYHVDTRVGFTSAMRLPPNAFLLENPKMDSR
jgi:hypothetical protein